MNPLNPPAILRTAALGLAITATSSAVPQNIREARFTKIPISPSHGDCYISSLPTPGEPHIPTILLATGGQGGGHISPMDAVATKLVERGDVRIVYDVHMPVCTFNRNPWDHFRYKSSNFPLGAAAANAYRRYVSARTQYAGVVSRANALVNAHEVDYVFANHRFIADSLSYGLPEHIPLGVGLADHGIPHHGWYVPRLMIDPSDNALIVTNGLTRAHAIENGNVPEANVHELGYPIRQEFIDVLQISREDARRALGIPDNKRVLMITAGNARNPGDLISKFRPVLAHEDVSNLYVMVLAVGNEKLETSLKKLGRELGVTNQMRILPMLNPKQMAMHMRASDIMAIQPGGGSVAECLQLGVVPVFWMEKSGIEHDNRRAIVEAQAGIAAFSKSALVAAIYGAQGGLQTMVDRGRSFLINEAAEKIADFLANEATRLSAARRISVT